MELSAAELAVKNRLDQNERIEQFSKLAREFILILDVINVYRQSSKTRRK